MPRWQRGGRRRLHLSRWDRRRTACRRVQPLQAFNENCVIPCPIVLGRFDCLQHLPHGVDDLQEHTRDLGVESQVAIAQAREQILGAVSDHLQLLEAEKTGRSFHGVHGAKDP